MNPNSALSVWQLAVMAAVPVVALAAWLTAIFLAAREPRGRAQAAAVSPAGADSAHVMPRPVAREGEPARTADGGIAA